MRTPSRRMPAASVGKAGVGKRILALVMFALGIVAPGLFFFWLHPVWAGAMLCAFISLVVYFARQERKRLETLMSARRDESICGLARSFKRGSVDTWVIRAVYEEIQAYLGHKVPLRSGDRLAEDLRLDDEDLEGDLALRIAGRSRRSVENTEANPWFGGVGTVGDLINFFDAQPRAT